MVKKTRDRQADAYTVLQTAVQTVPAPAPLTFVSEADQRVILRYLQRGDFPLHEHSISRGDLTSTPSAIIFRTTSISIA